jgi:hypothetical protein
MHNSVGTKRVERANSASGWTVTPTQAVLAIRMPRFMWAGMLAFAYVFGVVLGIKIGHRPRRHPRP